MIDLSVITVSCRPKWLANCLVQYGNQVFGQRSEMIVVGEGTSSCFEPVLNRWKPDKFICKEIEGYAGAFGKDVGLQHAKGEYVCFWDDDNIYYPYALDEILSAARGYDIGFVKAGIMGLGFEEVPRGEEITFGNIDTMCFAVRRELALTARWSDHRGVGTDYAWIKKLLRKKPSVNFLDVVIGEHLNG